MKKQHFYKSFRWGTILPTGILLVFITMGALAEIEGTFAVLWWTADGGSSVSAGSQFEVMGHTGQPDTEPMSGGNYQVSGGFWPGVLAQVPPPTVTPPPPTTTPPASVGKLFLPVISKPSPCFAGPAEIEPNDTALDANGPLCSGQTYTGYPNDRSDLFSFNTLHDGEIDIQLQNHTGQGVQLQLYYQDVLGQPVQVDFGAPYEFEYDGKAGQYYIFIFAESGYNSNDAYTLTVTYP